MKYDVHGGSLHCFRYCVSTAETFGRIYIALSLITKFTKIKLKPNLAKCLTFVMDFVVVYIIYSALQCTFRLYDMVNIYVLHSITYLIY